MPTLPHQYTDDGRNILEEIGLEGLSHPPSLPPETVIKSDGTKWVYGQVSGNGNGGTAKKTFLEKLTITTNGVFPPLSFTPSDVRNFWLRINGTTHTPVAGGFTVNASTKQITQTAGTGYGVRAGWTVEVEYYTDDDTSPPNLTSFAPTSAGVGATLTLTGTNFNGISSVTIAGIPVAFTVVSLTQITVTIPVEMYDGAITVTGTTGSSTLPGFDFLTPLPTITSFAPTTGIAGETITITGTNFYGLPQVRMGGLVSPNVVVNSLTSLTATVPFSNAAGTVEVETLYGTASKTGFLWALPPSNVFLVPSGANSLRAVQKTPRQVLAATFPAVTAQVYNPLLALGRHFVPHLQTVLVYDGTFALKLTIGAATLGIGRVLRAFEFNGKIAFVGETGTRFGSYNAGTEVWTNGALVAHSTTDAAHLNGKIYACADFSSTPVNHNLTELDVASESLVARRNVAAASESYRRIIAGDGKVLLSRTDGLQRIVSLSTWASLSTQNHGNLSGVGVFAQGAFWLTNNISGLLLRIDSTTFAATFPLTTLNNPRGLVTDGTMLYIAQASSNNIVVVDAATGAINGTPVGTIGFPNFFQS